MQLKSLTNWSQVELNYNTSLYCFRSSQISNINFIDVMLQLLGQVNV